MAQTSSATREPSMEEILASIRRIIEDSDVTRQGANEYDQDTAATVIADSPVPFLRSTEKRGEIAPFRRPGFAETEQENYASKNAADPAPLAANQPLAEQPSHADDRSAPLSLQAVLRGTLSGSFRADEERAEQHQKTVNDLRIATINPPVPPAVAAAIVVQPVVSLVPDMNIPSSVNVQPEVSYNETPTAKGEASVEVTMTDKPLISEAVGRQVAASFGSLSDAVYTEQMRLLDEKTDAMLRPMLQNWLDTNLPPLVERLVREEIERVVRGSHS